MNIYRRHFRVNSGPLIDAIANHKAIQKQSNEQYKQIIQDIGANADYYVRCGKLVAFTFDNPPDQRLYKRVNNGWYPKKNIAFGRELDKRIKSVKTSDINDCLSIFGLYYGPSIIWGGRGHYPSIRVIPYWQGDVAIVSVPWYDADPVKLDDYRQKKEKSVCFDMTLDSLLWEPSTDMAEIKEWQAHKEIEEWNESVRAAKSAE